MLKECYTSFRRRFHERKNIKNAEKAVFITTALTFFIAGFEIFNALKFYKPGMNLLDIASYVFADPWIYGFTFIFANLALLPSALLLYKGNEISLKDEICDKKNLGGDILWGLTLMTVAAIADLMFIPINMGRTDQAFADENSMSIGLVVLYFISLVLVSGICKEIYFRGFAKHFCSSIFGEMTAFLLFNMLFGLLDWYNMGYSFILGLICIYGYLKRKRLIVPMIIHGGVNFIGIIYSLIMQSV